MKLYEYYMDEKLRPSQVELYRSIRLKRLKATLHNQVFTSRYISTLKAKVKGVERIDILLKVNKLATTAAKRSK